MQKLMHRSITALVVLLALTAFQAEAGIIPKIGIRAGKYTENSDFFLGADLDANFLLVHGNANIEYVFADNATLATFNLDGYVDFSIIPFVNAWVGAGIGSVYTNPDGADSRWDGAFNLLLGAGLGIPLHPYVQFKYIISDTDMTVLGVGIRF